MKNILSWIEENKQQFEGDGPRTMAQEPRNMAQGGRIGFSSGGAPIDPLDPQFKLDQVIKAYKRYRRGEKNPKLNFQKFFEIYAKENFADGGSAGQLVRNTVDGSRPGYRGKDVMPERITISELHDFLGLEKSKGNAPFNKIYRNLEADAYLALNPGKVAKDTTGTQWRIDKPSKAQAEEIMKIHVGSGGAQSGKIRKATADAVRKLYKDKAFMNFLEKYKKGDKIPTQVIRKIFSADGAYSPHIASTLGRILEGQLELEGIKVNKKLGAKIQQGMEYSTKGKGLRGAWHSAAYVYAKNQLNSLDPSKSFRSYQNDITKLLKELNLPNMSVDEIQAIRTGHTGGTNPWSVFSQIMTEKQNKLKGSRFDSEVSKKQIRLNDAIKKHGKNSQEVKNIITEQDDFVKSFKDQHPEFKKINLTKFDLRSPKQVLGAKVYNELPSGISDALDADFAKNKYSINVGEGALTQKQLISKLSPVVSDVKALTQGKAWNKAIKSSKAKMLAKTLQLAGINICSSQLAASGGRIGFAKKVCGMKFAEQNEDAFMKKAGQSDEAAKMFKSGKIRPFLMKAKNWAKNNMGPMGWIGGELLVVGLGTAWDMSQGKGWKEAMDNWTGLGGHFGQAEKRLRQIGVEQGYSETELNDAMKIGQLMDLSTEVEGKQWELDQIQEQQDIGGTARVKYDPKLPGAYKPIQGQYQDPKKIRDLKTEVPKMWEEGTEIYESLKDFPTSETIYGSITGAKELEEKEKKAKIVDWLTRYKILPEKDWMQSIDTIGYMGGGMVGIRKPHAIAPTRGPQSQGLASTPEYDTYSKEYKWQI